MKLTARYPGFRLRLSLRSCVALLFSSLVCVSPLKAEESAMPVSAAQARVTLDGYLFDAARRGRLEMLQEFVAANYDLDAADHRGYTALILAAYNGQSEAVDLLIGAGANPCAEDRRGNTALMGAIFKGELSIARKLMAAGCATGHRNKAGQTPAMYAALFQRAEILEALETDGADLSAVDVAGNSVESLQRGEVRGVLTGDATATVQP